ncbi:unnamed protein product [Schistosoma margrebowiei]|uniref:Uncharacterized protein n=1 Tax=Schistosoma margrebowiei TaxID=48269 RepID=A0A183LZ52_9TREM|nr:unnamed protein product [Schistosoma margrebowiei]
MSISEKCPEASLNPIVPETQCTNTDLSSSQKDDVLLKEHEIVTVPAHEETENESSNIMKTVSPNGARHSTTNVSDKSTCPGSLVVLPDIYLLTYACYSS